MTVKRFSDLCFVTLLFLPVFFITLAIFLLIKIDSAGPVLHWSKRVGSNNKIFLMPKFRTMFMDTPDCATHLLDNPGQHITKIGKFLRKSSLDELPQLYSVLRGDMSMVGPRPALHNQYDLIKLRTVKDIHHLRPGITGWAQVNGRDSISIQDKVEYDEQYLDKQSLFFDIKIVFLTFASVLNKQGVSH